MAPAMIVSEEFYFVPVLTCHYTPKFWGSTVKNHIFSLRTSWTDKLPVKIAII